MAAQTPRTIPLTDKDGKPVVGSDGKPATVTMSVDNTTPPAASALPPDKVVITVGDEKITAGDVDRLIEILPEASRANLRGPGRRQLVDNLVKIKLLAQAARKNKLDQTPNFHDQVTFQIENLLANLYFQEMNRSLVVDEAAERAYYEQHKNEYEKVRARHILIRMTGSPVPVKPGQKDLSEQDALAKAKELRARIAAGADFAALAKAESDDTGSGANGGDLGLFGHGQMVPSFEQAAFAMSVGQLSEPVRSQFGFHIIKVEAKEAQTFEQKQAEIAQRLRPEMAQKAVDEMRKKTAVTVDPAFLPEEKKAAAK